jgi:hypothetical protein
MFKYTCAETYLIMVFVSQESVMLLMAIIIFRSFTSLSLMHLNGTSILVWKQLKWVSSGKTAQNK